MADILSSSDQQDNVLEEDTSFDEKRPMYTSAERLLRLLHFLLANDCTRDAIFLHLADYYHIDDAGQPLSSTSRGAAERMLRRDILFLKKQGFHIHTTRATRSRPVRYQLVKGSGPSSIFLLNDAEVESLAFLYTLFADPNRYARIHQSQPLPLPPARNPFADDVLQLIEKFSAMLPEAQRKLFNRSIEKPFVYFQMAPVTDFFPYRPIIDTIVRAIALRQQIQFAYTPTHGSQPATFHQHVDPYYVIYLEEHFYLIGYSHQSNEFLEFRIDRIRGDSLRIQPDMIDVERRRRPITFHFWIDGNMAKQGLSRRWLSQTQIREETYLDAYGKTRRRVLMRATAYSEFRIIQQLLRYGDKAELVDPPHLRKKMRDTVKHMNNFYEKDIP
jgi:predicted DNA-binding transcriptional regulator YafY